MSILFKRVVVLGAVAWAVGAFMCGCRSQSRRKHTEVLLDDGLEGTYPASDPVSSQNFDIPANRQAGVA